MSSFFNSFSICIALVAQGFFGIFVPFVAARDTSPSELMQVAQRKVGAVP